MLAVSLFLISGCGSNDPASDSSNVSTNLNNSLSAFDSNFDSNSDIIIPNPAETNGQSIAVRIPHGNFYAELGFLGFKNKVQVEAYATDQKENQIGKAIKLNGENEVANKVILAIIAAKDENADITDLNQSIEALQGYFAVLDYKTHKSYLTKVNVLPNDMALKYVEGIDDSGNFVIVYRDWYKYADTEVYKFFPNEGKYKNIYANFTGEGDNKEFNDNYFSGYLLDDYKAVVECKLLGYSKTISLLDAGLKKDDLETKYAIKENEPEPEDYFITREYRRYQNGKWTGEKYTNMVVYRSEFEDYQSPTYFKFKYPFNVGTDFLLGYANMYFEYNAETQKLEPMKASFEIQLF